MPGRRGWTVVGFESSRPARIASARLLLAGDSLGFDKLAAPARLPASRPPSLRRTMSENGSDRTNTGQIIEIKGVVIDAVFPRPPARDLHRPRDRDRRGRRRPHARRGGAAAPRRRPRPRRRDGLDRRPRARRRRRRHRRADLGPGRRGDARPHLERDRRADRRGADPGGHGALVDPPRPARLPRPVADGRDLRDRHQGHRPDRARTSRAARSASSAAPASARPCSSRS